MRRFGTGWWDRHYRLVSRLLLAGIILLLLHALQLKLTPAFHGAAQIAAQNLATELVNEQVVEILQDYDGDFATIERAEDGRVLSVGLDAVKANLLKAELSQKLTKELDNLAARSISCKLRIDIPAIRSASIRFGVTTAARGSSSAIRVSTASSLSRGTPLVEIITGSTINIPFHPFRHSATTRISPSENNIPVLIARTSNSASTA